MSGWSERWKVIVEFTRTNDVSDVSLAGRHITARLEGRIVRLSEDGALGEADIREMIGQLLAMGSVPRDPSSDPMFAADFTITLFDHRFRVHVARARGEMFASLRPLPDHPPEVAAVGLSSQVVKAVGAAHSGLVLITGPTGSGKTTTIAALVEAINRSRQVKIVTIEDPIEFLFVNKAAEIIQREVGTDTASYESGLREALRQNPDVIVIGEIRDAETAVVALQAAETGHLVIGSLHANSVVESITRYILLGPRERSHEMRFVLAKSMRLITNQRLVRRREGGRIAIREVCLHAPNVEAVILRENEQELSSYMLAGRECGMIDFQSALKSLQGVIDPQDYLRFRQ
jgi:twitching motility protein PilT